MTVVETLLILVAIPAAVFGLLALLTLRPKSGRPRYREGQEWDFAPVFWVANPVRVSSTPPEDAGEEARTDEEAQPSTARGGARGNW